MSIIQENSDKPFVEVLELMAEGVAEQEKTMPDCFEALELIYGFTLPSGAQVQIRMGRDILDD